MVLKNKNVKNNLTSVLTGDQLTNERTNERTKQADISVLRIAATLAVILLHTCNTITNNSADYLITDSQHYVLTSITFLMNWAVPVFFMISGALLINGNKEINYDLVLRKYCKRILLALIVFGIPFSMMEIFMNTRTLSLSMIPKACLNILTGNSWGHLWYLYVLIGLYLVLPVINVFINKASRRTSITFIALIFIFCFLIPMVNRLFEVKIAFEMPIMSYALFYFIVGKMLYAVDSNVFIKKWICGCVLALLVLLLLVINSYGGCKYLEYNSPLIAAISICIFLLLKGIRLEVSKRMWKVDRLCFGVYLIHPLFVNFLYKFMKITPLSFSKFYIVAVIVMWGIFVIVSFAASYAMYLIKPLKKYVL